MDLLGLTKEVDKYNIGNEFLSSVTSLDIITDLDVDLVQIVNACQTLYKNIINILLIVYKPLVNNSDFTLNDLRQKIKSKITFLNDSYQKTFPPDFLPLVFTQSFNQEMRKILDNNLVFNRVK